MIENIEIKQFYDQFTCLHPLVLASHEKYFSYKKMSTYQN